MTGSKSWRDALTQAIPDLEVRNWDQAGDPAEIDFALVWLPPQRALRRFPNLKAILNLGAGVDALLKDPDLPEGVPIVRMVDEDLAQMHGGIRAAACSALPPGAAGAGRAASQEGMARYRVARGRPPAGRRDGAGRDG